MHIFCILTTLILFVVITPAMAQNAKDDAVAILYTRSGPLVIEFFLDDAPNHVQNFLDLAKDGYYNGTAFHRVIEGFMIQGGDPNTRLGSQSIQTWGTGGPTYTINAEFNDIKHNRGIVSMARATDPDSAGSQFFIVHQDSNFLDGSYTVFGRLATEESFKTLDKIAMMDTPALLQEAPQGAPGATIPLNWQDTIIEKIEVVERADVPGIAKWQEPERSAVPEPPSSDSEYSNEELGIAFAVPRGWDVQEAGKTDLGAPAIVVLGPPAGGLPISIYIEVTPAEGKTLDDFLEEVETALQNQADRGLITLLSNGSATVSGLNAHTMDVISNTLTTAGNLADVRFRQTTTLHNDKIYTIVYAAEAQSFNRFQDRYETLLETFTFTVSNSSASEGGGCLIATATFGSEMTTQVQQLREIRDEIVLQTDSGRTFMAAFNDVYYTLSPTVADLERQYPALRELIRVGLTPMLAALSLLSYADADSEAEVIAYGLAAISLNLAFYLVVPATMIYLWLRRATRPHPPRPALGSPCRPVS